MPRARTSSVRSSMRVTGPSPARAQTLPPSAAIARARTPAIAAVTRSVRGSTRRTRSSGPIAQTAPRRDGDVIGDARSRRQRSPQPAGGSSRAEHGCRDRRARARSPPARRTGRAAQHRRCPPTRRPRPPPGPSVSLRWRTCRSPSNPDRSARSSDRRRSRPRRGLRRRPRRSASRPPGPGLAPRRTAGTRRRRVRPRAEAPAPPPSRARRAGPPRRARRQRPRARARGRRRRRGTTRTAPGRRRSSSGSCRSIASCSARNSRLGSRPSSSTSVRRSSA